MAGDFKRDLIKAIAFGRKSNGKRVRRMDPDHVEDILADLLAPAEIEDEYETGGSYEGPREPRH